MDIVYSKESLIIYLNSDMNKKSFNILKKKLDYIIHQYKINLILFRYTSGITIDNKYINILNDEYLDVKVNLQQI